MNAHFDFFGKTLLGQQELAPRWRRCGIVLFLVSVLFV